MTSTLRRAGALTALPLTLFLSGCGDLATVKDTAKDTAASASTSVSSAASSLSSRASSAAHTSGSAATSGAATGAGKSSSAAEATSSAGTAGTAGASETPASSADAGAGAGAGSGQKYQVVSVVDGDTIKVRINGEKVTVRLIGVDTPETKKPHVAVQCYGKEASAHMQSLVQQHSVQLVADPTQGSTDKYGRLLRYVYVGDTNVGYSQIEGGYAREYTYDKAYRYQAQFRAAQAAAQAAKRGTWGGVCQGFHTGDTATSTATASSTSAQASTPAVAPSSTLAVSTQAAAPVTPSAVVPTISTQAPTSAPTSAAGCTIKGNISSSGEKIAHLPGSATYARTRISAASGERMFCSESEAIAAGWRIAKD